MGSRSHSAPSSVTPQSRQCTRRSSCSSSARRTRSSRRTPRALSSRRSSWSSSQTRSTQGGSERLSQTPLPRQSTSQRGQFLSGSTCASTARSTQTPSTTRTKWGARQARQQCHSRWTSSSAAGTRRGTITTCGTTPWGSRSSGGCGRQ